MDLAVLELSMLTSLASACFCLPGAAVKGVCHQSPAFFLRHLDFFFRDILFRFTVSSKVHPVTRASLLETPAVKD